MKKNQISKSKNQNDKSKFKNSMCKFILIAGIVFVSVVPLCPTTRHVYESDGAQGIQDSINVSGAYDTVFVHTGTYYARDVDANGSFPHSCGGGVYCNNSSPTIIENTISENLNGGLYICNSSPTITSDAITNNVADTGGAIYNGIHGEIAIDSCFIVDNSSTNDTKSGMTYIAFDADTIKIAHSNLYYNTFQPDTEIDNNTSISIPLENNFWWDTTDSGISALIKGPRGRRL